jgi:hypothetical protein
LLNSKSVYFEKRREIVRSLIDKNKLFTLKSVLDDWEQSGEDTLELEKYTEKYDQLFLIFEENTLLAVDESKHLIWEKSPDSTRKNWSEAKQYCRFLSKAGLQHWYLPSSDQMLESFVNIRTGFFNFTEETSSFWSSTEEIDYGSKAIRVSYRLNKINGEPVLKKFRLFVRCAHTF